MNEQQTERLRAAAPELLEALKSIVDYCQPPALKSERIAKSPTNKQLEEARAAIAKATGGASE